LIKAINQFPHGGANSTFIRHIQVVSSRKLRNQLQAGQTSLVRLRLNIGLFFSLAQASWNQGLLLLDLKLRLGRVLLQWLLMVLLLMLLLLMELLLLLRVHGGECGDATRLVHHEGCRLTGSGGVVVGG